MADLLPVLQVPKGSVTPYVLMGVVALTLVILFPPLATWLPKALIK